MFTGLVEEKGRVIAVDEHGDAVRLRFAGPLVTSDATHGASIAVNGACLTAIDVVGEEFSADVMAESLAKTTLGDLRVGDEVNLERAMSLGDRLGGHIVQGHVDGTGEVLERLASEHWEIVWFSAPAHVAKYLVSKGSVTVDGTSLTVVEVEDAGGQHRFSVSLIPRP
jgi:riboflavin synthase